MRCPARVGPAAAGLAGENSMELTRRDVGRLALAALPVARAYGALNSKFGGVQIGAISYSFRGINGIDEIIKTMVDLGLGEIELMSNSVEAYAGVPSTGMGGFPAGGAAGRQGPGARGAAPGAGNQPMGMGGGRQPLTPEQQEAARKRQEENAQATAKWRSEVSLEKFKEVRQKFDAAGIELALLCYNMRDQMPDEQIDFAFRIAKAMRCRGITTSTTVSMSKRIAAVADRHKMLVGYHGHDQTSDPNEFATLESYATAFGYSKYNGINLDVGHFTASNYDAVAFIKQHHARITNLHIKDRKKDHGPNVPWGQGDTPLKDILMLLKKEKYPFPANIELEYPVPAGSTVQAEMKKCFDYVKKILA